MLYYTVFFWLWIMQSAFKDYQGAWCNFADYKKSLQEKTSQEQIPTCMAQAWCWRTSGDVSAQLMESGLKNMVATFVCIQVQHRSQDSELHLATDEQVSIIKDLRQQLETATASASTNIATENKCIFIFNLCHTYVTVGVKQVQMWQGVRKFVEFYKTLLFFCNAIFNFCSAATEATHFVCRDNVASWPNSL